MKADEMTIMFQLDAMKRARRELGNPAALDEALVATGIDALFFLMDGGRVRIDGKVWELQEALETP